MNSKTFYLKETMSICRTTIVEFQTEVDAEALIKDYNENYESMFPTVEIVLNSKVNPTTTINNAVFADMKSIEKTDSEARQAFLEKHKNGMKNVITYVGEVTLSK